MTPSILPLPKAIYLCDDVLLDRTSQKTHLLGVFNAARPPESVPYPFALGQLCVVVQLVGGVGEIPVHVEIAHARTEELVYASPEIPLRFPGRQTIVTACFRIRNCSFPEPGVYLVEFYCRGTFLDDRALHLLQEKGSES